MPETQSVHQHIRVSRRARTIPARPGLRNRLLPRDTPLLRLQPGLLRPPEAQLQLGGALGNRLQPLRTGGRAATSVGALQRTDQAAGGPWAGPVTEPGVAAAKQRTRARRDRRASISACSRSSSRCLRRFAAVSGSLQWGEASDRCQCWRQQPQGRNRSPVWRLRWLATGASCAPGRRAVVPSHRGRHAAASADGGCGTRRRGWRGAAESRRTGRSSGSGRTSRPEPLRRRRRPAAPATGGSAVSAWVDRPATAAAGRAPAAAGGQQSGEPTPPGSSGCAPRAPARTRSWLATTTRRGSTQQGRCSCSTARARPSNPLGTALLLGSRALPPTRPARTQAQARTDAGAMPGRRGRGPG